MKSGISLNALITFFRQQPKQTFNTDAFNLMTFEGHKSTEYPKGAFIGYSSRGHSSHTDTMGLSVRSNGEQGNGDSRRLLTTLGLGNTSLIF